jgi:23S rRNA (cytidine1920-2'-O)/16S rRNA (cytidine1409-2'-O)-methyltransferase
VLVAGSVAEKASRQVSPAEPLEVLGDPCPFVSRGGVKLDAALTRFGVTVQGRRCLDAGASTGGFTDCLLQRGAQEVVAVDVGHGQLDQRLRQDRRVLALEGTHVALLRLDDVGGHPFGLVVADLSFISLRRVAGVLLGELASQGADAVVLVKPQFEVGRREASRGRGVVSDPDLWRASLVAVASALLAAGAAMMGAMASPLLGAAGNAEFFVHARAHAPEHRYLPEEEVDRAIQEASVLAGS